MDESFQLSDRRGLTAPAGVGSLHRSSGLIAAPGRNHEYAGCKAANSPKFTRWQPRRVGQLGPTTANSWILGDDTVILPAYWYGALR